MSKFIKLSSVLLVDVNRIIKIRPSENDEGESGISITIDGNYTDDIAPHYWYQFESIQWSDIVNIPELNQDMFIHTTALERWKPGHPFNDIIINKNYIKIVKVCDDDPTKTCLIWSQGTEIVDIPIDDVAKILMEE